MRDAMQQQSYALLMSISKDDRDEWFERAKTETNSD